MNIKQFQKTVYDYWKTNKRDLPWRHNTTPYHVLVSEVMLQQTQVSRVIAKYKPFLKQFSTIKKLAEADLKDVLLEWQGLGYNRRGLNVKKAAEMVLRDFGGQVGS